MRSHHRGLARTQRHRPTASRQHFVENTRLQPRRCSCLSLGDWLDFDPLPPWCRLPFGEEELRINTALTITVLVGNSSTSPASAQMGLADSKRGQELSARLCSGCHIVAPGSADTTNVDVPTFAAAFAGRPDTTAERLAGRINGPERIPSTAQAPGRRHP